MDANVRIDSEVHGLTGTLELTFGANCLMILWCATDAMWKFRRVGVSSPESMKTAH